MNAWHAFSTAASPPAGAAATAHAPRSQPNGAPPRDAQNLGTAGEAAELDYTQTLLELVIGLATAMRLCCMGLEIDISVLQQLAKP